MKCSKTRVFGQHRLVDRRILREIIRSSQISKDEVVCEAGTGDGELTRELCKLAKRVISYEIDNVLYMRNIACLSNFSNLLLVHSNIFKVSNVEFNVFVSNLPYSSSREAIMWLALRKFKRAIVMLQKEFVSKLLAKPGERNYRSISVIGQYCFKIDNLFDVNRTSFLPQPQVDSQVVRLTPFMEYSIDNQTLGNLNRIFSHKNKKASSVARAFGSPQSSYPWDNYRIDQLSPSDLVSLSQSMRKAQDMVV